MIRVTSPWRSGAVLLTVVAVALASGGCASQQRQEMAKRLIRSAAVAERQRTASGTFAFSVKVLKVNGIDLAAQAREQKAEAARGSTVPGPTVPAATTGGGTPFGGPGAARSAEQTSPPFVMDIDLAKRRAAIVVRPSLLTTMPDGTPVPPEARNGPDVPLAVYNRYAVFRYSPPVTADQPADAAAPPDAAAPTDEADDEEEVVRSWLKLDFASIDSRARAQLQTLNPFPALSPVLLVGLLRGTLTGSVTSLGPATVDGVATTHYRFNVDRQKAYLALSDRDQETIDRIFHRDGMTATVFKDAEAWLDDQGRPRQVRFRFKQTVDRDNEARIGFRLRLTDFGKPVTVAVPGVDVTASVADYPQLVSSHT